MATSMEALRTRLEMERERLREEIAALGYLHARGWAAVTDLERYGNHEADIATEAYEQEKDTALETNLRRLLGLTENALHRFERDEYGVCAHCGQPIPMERLEALPHATLCMRCQREQEAIH